jgi:hypothetical protein
MKHTFVLAGMVGALLLSGQAVSAAERRGNPAGVTLSDYLNQYRGIFTNDPYTSQRKASTQRRMGDLKEEVRKAEDRRWISRREADNLDDRLMRVHRFMLKDRNLSNSELERCDRDLDGIERDLQRRAGSEHYRSRDLGAWDRGSRRDRRNERDRDRRDPGFDLGNIFGNGVFGRP